MWHIICVCYINTTVVSTESTLCFTINRLKFHVCSTVSLIKQIYIERDIFTKRTSNINVYSFITKLSSSNF